VGEEHEHLGFIFIYGVGHLVIIFVAENLGPPNYPPPLNPRYSQKMGPATLGVAVAPWHKEMFQGKSAQKMFHSVSLVNDSIFP
jgi:hypothetical protein